MWNVIMQRYQICTATEVGDHFRHLHRKQGNNKKIQDWWVSLTSARAYLLFARRHVDDVVLCDIVKVGSLSIHASWTALIVSGITTKARIEELICNRRVHIETKLAATEFETKTSPVAFPGSASMNSDDIASIHEQLTALTVELRSMKRSGSSGRGGRGRGRGRGSSWDSQPDTRECYECGKVGHIRFDCPDLPRNKKKHDSHEDYAGFAIAFVALLDHAAAAPAQADTAETTWVVDSGTTCHCSSVLSDFTNLGYRQ
jgi:hypothetical protein